MECVCNNQLFLKLRFTIRHYNDVAILARTGTLEFTFEICLYNEEIGTNIETFIFMFTDFNVTDEVTIIMLVKRIDMP